jgi:carbamoyl-phosphate synthase small subunit
MTQPHIGNYGLLEVAEESRRPWVEGFVAREFTGGAVGARPRVAGRVPGELGIPALDGIDTRALVRRLRDRGAMRGVIAAASEDAPRWRASSRPSPRWRGARWSTR